MSGDPDSNLASLITRGNIDFYPVSFISARDPDFFFAGGSPNDGVATVIFFTAGLASNGSGAFGYIEAAEYFDWRMYDDLVVTWFDEDSLFLPLVVCGFDEDLLCLHLVVAWLPAFGVSLLNDLVEAAAEGEVVAGPSVSRSAMISRWLGPS